MRFFQKSRAVLPQDILSVASKESYAQILGLSVTGQEYVFELLFKLNLNSKVKNITDYEKIDVQIKTKAGNSGTVELDTYFKNDKQKKINPVALDQAEEGLQIINGIPGAPRPKYPASVNKKLYSGIKTTDDLLIKEQLVYQTHVWIDQIINESLSSVYSYVTLIKPETIEQQEYFRQTNSDEVFDSDEIASFMNKNSFAISQYDESNINVWSTPQKLISDYLYEQVAKKPADSKIVVHRPIRKSGILQEITVPMQVLIPTVYQDISFDVICSLYKKNSSNPDEILNLELYTPGYIEEFESFTKSNSSLEVTATSSGFQHSLSINLVGDVEERNKLFGFNIYRQIVEKTGVVSEFQFMSTITTFGSSANYTFNSSYPLEIVRVIPIYKNTKESHIFRDVVVGEKYATIGSLAITTRDSSDRIVDIDVFGIPKETKNLRLYRRICAHPNSKFEFVKVMQINNNLRTATILDEPPEVGKLSDIASYEYFVAARMADQTSNDKLILSNYVVHQRKQFEIEKSVQVLITDVNNNSMDTVDPMLSFNISTKFSSSESKKVTDELQNQILDIYNKYVNPQNIIDPATSGGQKIPGVPQYADLFFHEVVRTNITTSERETFELIGEGLFEDSNSTRAKKRIKPINPQNRYLYQIFTYVRSPFELFKNFVAHGRLTGAGSNGRDWFYLPYKWKNPQTKNGLLYSSDAEGIPMIPEDESLKAVTYGMTAQFKLDDIKDQVSIDQIFASRVTKRTVKISWSVNMSSINSSTSSPYDSFIVLAVVNGKKKYVGVTRLNFMYHSLDHGRSDLSKNDYGTIYYIIIPILKQLYLDSPAYSNELTIDPTGLHDVIKVPNTTLEQKLNQLELRTGVTK